MTRCELWVSKENQKGFINNNPTFEIILLAIFWYVCWQEVTKDNKIDTVIHFSFQQHFNLQIPSFLKYLEGFKLCPWRQKYLVGKLSITKTELLSVILFPLISCRGFPGGSDGKESTCNAEDPASISGSGRSTGQGNGNPL